EPFIVRALDDAGRPIANLPVTWSRTSGQGSLFPVDGGRTDADGYASARFIATDIQPGSSWDQGTVAAASSAGSVSFFVTTIQSRNQGQPAGQPLVQVIDEDFRVTGRAGATVPDAFRVQVVSVAGLKLGQGIPNVGVR